MSRAAPQRQPSACGGGWGAERAALDVWEAELGAGPDQEGQPSTLGAALDALGERGWGEQGPREQAQHTATGGDLTVSARRLNQGRWGCPSSWAGVGGHPGVSGAPLGRGGDATPA